ncbi:hypothetical protein QR680_008094 [Steinernema hermaphroditum]|uniref:Proteasome alpha-type subunits domain-containing protein n=1 Tax=Steinernema hermaphroditum TaxID=289476 RepID=A0AA39M6F5_9BILA|nr:hypothetical protein QR680_008094 [Steinernema hermaphroditum]
MTAMGYDQHAGIFSPNGQVLQIEYAQKCVDASVNVIAINGNNGVLLTVDRPLSSKAEMKNANKRVAAVNGSIIFACSGLFPDGMAILDYARGEALKYRKQYSTEMPIEELVRSVAEHVHHFTLGGNRPYGASVVFASWSEIEGGKLFAVDPSGMCQQYEAWAFGKNRLNMRNDIDRIRKDCRRLRRKRLRKESARILLNMREASLKTMQSRIEMAWCGFSTLGKAIVLHNEQVKHAVIWAFLKQEAACEEGDDRLNEISSEEESDGMEETYV